MINNVVGGHITPTVHTHKTPSNPPFTPQTPPTPPQNNSCTISFDQQALTLRSPGGAVEKPREEVVPFSIGAAPPAAAASAASAAKKGKKGEGEGDEETMVASAVAEEGVDGLVDDEDDDDDEPLGNLPPSRGGVSMAGF